MIDPKSLTGGLLRLTTQMICDEAQKRGWRAELYSVHSPLLRLTRSDGKVIEIYSATPPTTSFRAAKTSDDKLVTQMILEEHNLPTIKSRMLHDIGEVEVVLQSFPTDRALVVKPLDASHGNGVNVNLRGLTTVKAAVTDAMAFSRSVLIQEFINDAVDIRLLCLDYKFIAGLVRQPAGVTGDGIHTIRELIEIENSQEYRGKNYTRLLNEIDIDRAKQYVDELIDSIPEKGIRVPVVGTANVGTGGETHDITKLVPGWLIDMAEKAARAVDLPVCGVDFLIKQFPQPDMTKDDLQPVIIELNKGPSLFIHETPTHGDPQPVIKQYVDYLGRI